MSSNPGMKCLISQERCMHFIQFSNARYPQKLFFICGYLYMARLIPFNIWRRRKSSLTTFPIHVLKLKKVFNASTLIAPPLLKHGITVPPHFNFVTSISLIAFLIGTMILVPTLAILSERAWTLLFMPSAGKLGIKGSQMF